MFEQSGSTETQRKNGIYETRVGRTQVMRVSWVTTRSLNFILTGEAVGHHQTSLRNQGLHSSICRECGLLMAHSWALPSVKRR